MRLIDADALMKAMYERAFETDGDTMWQSGCWVRYRAVEQVIKECPAIELESDDAEANYWHEKANCYEQTLVKLAQNKQPEIIRCKDCKHYVLHVLFGRVQGWCERLCDEFDKSLARDTEDDDFCSRAESREEKGE